MQGKKILIFITPQPRSGTLNIIFPYSAAYACDILFDPSLLVNFLLGIFHIAGVNPEPRPVPPCKGRKKASRILR
jgi:hypothetical protein